MPPCKPSPVCDILFPAMETKELNTISSMYHKNMGNQSTECSATPTDSQNIAICATIIEFLKPQIEGIVKSIAAELVQSVAFRPTKTPPPPEDNSDPEPLATSVCKTLGSLGLQSLEDLKGFQYDAQDHILLHVKGRMADSGWLKGDPKLDALGRIMADHRLEFNMLS